MSIEGYGRLVEGERKAIEKPWDAAKIACMSTNADANKFDAAAIRKQAMGWKP